MNIEKTTEIETKLRKATALIDEARRVFLDEGDRDFAEVLSVTIEKILAVRVGAICRETSDAELDDLGLCTDSTKGAKTE